MVRIVVDVETTGLDPIVNDIIDISLFVINDQFEIIDEFRQTVKPDPINSITWDQEAQNVHGYTKKDVSVFMNRKKFCIKLLHFLVPHKNEDNSPLEFICHALPEKFFDPNRKQFSWPHIDYHFLEWAFRKENLERSFFKVFSTNNITSTIKLARKHTGNHRGHKLNVWAENIGFKLDHHNAKSDALACLELYKYFMENQCTPLETTNKKELTLYEES